MDQNAWELGKNYPTEVGIYGHPKPGLDELTAVLRETMTPAQRETAVKRGREQGEVHRKLREQLQAKASSESKHKPLTPLATMAALAKVFPKNGAVVEEAVTTTGTTLERLGAIQDPSGYFAHRGWALGWGLGCSIGVKLAWPHRPVLGVLGEGASLYGIQGLWTAAKYKIPVTFVICNNAQYQILKVGAQGMSLPRATEGRFEGMDLSGPEVDMVSLARSFGVEAHRITDAEELSDRVKESFSRETPILFDVPIIRGARGSEFRASAAAPKRRVITCTSQPRLGASARDFRSVAARFTPDGLAKQRLENYASVPLVGGLIGQNLIGLGDWNAFDEIDLQIRIAILNDALPSRGMLMPHFDLAIGHLVPSDRDRRLARWLRRPVHG